MSIDFTWLEENFFKKELTASQKELVSKKVQILEYQADSIIVEQGSMGHAVYFVYSGSASIASESNGETLHLNSVKSGSMFGEMSFLTGAAVSASVIAREDCVIYKLSRDAFRDLMKYDQELTFSVFVQLLNHTAEIIRHLTVEKAAVQHYLSGSRF